MGVFGLLHLTLTFRGPGLLPRGRDLQARMAEQSPVITTETTMWKAWIGFNASHSCGLLLFGLVYAYLALFRAEMLFNSTFLLLVGFVFLVGFIVLAWKYFFSVPFRGILLATALYVAGVLFSRS